MLSETDMNLLFNVYAFIDDRGIPYYIGQTLYFENRSKDHFRKVKTNPQLKYVRARELIDKGTPFVIQLLHKDVTKAIANILEIYYMRRFPNLTNHYEKKLNYKSIKHGKLGTQVYHTWTNMRDRCSNPNNAFYKIYGGRGIEVDKSWEDFNTFYKDIGDPPSPKHSLDRIDNSQGYFSSNCRWATSSEQARNTRRNIMITYKDKTQCLMNWSEELNMPYFMLRKRISDGWSIEDSFETPHNNHRRYVTHQGITKTIQEWSKCLNINKNTLIDRLFYMGWSTDRSFKVPNKKRDNYVLTYKGETKTLTEWANYLGINRNTLRGRIQKGWDLEKSFNYKQASPPTFTFENKTMTLVEWSNFLNIKKSTLKDRIYKLGWSIEKALKKEGT